MDKTDYEIIKELTKNSANSFLKIAKKIGTSSMTVQKRYEKMKKKGIILGTSMMIDLSLLGFKGKAFLFIKYSICSELNDCEKIVMQIPNLFLFTTVIGEYDALGMLVYRNNSEIKEVSDKIRATKCVKQVKVAVTTDTFYPVKREFLKNITKLLDSKLSVINQKK